MITLREFMETVNYRITEGSEYYCAAFGNKLHSLSAWNGDQDSWSMNVVFDTETQVVYLVEACDYGRSRAYRHVNPDYYKEFMDSDKSSYRDQAWDDIKYIDLETPEDWLEKADAIVDGVEYDTRVEVPLDLDDELMLQLAKEAHKRDITLNKMVEEILQEAIHNAKP